MAIGTLSDCLNVAPGNLESVMSAFHDLTLDALDGKLLPLETFKGHVVLVVNVASNVV